MPGQIKTKVFANDKLAYIWWSYPAKIKDCLGFSVRRVSNGLPDEPLPTLVGFEPGVVGAPHPKKTSDEWPIQSYQWKDLSALPGTYRYRIVPMIGPDPDALTEDLANAALTDFVTIGPLTTGPVRPVFNVGLISTQAIAKALPKKPDGTPDGGVLRKEIAKKGSPIRSSLSGGVERVLTSLFERAKKSGGKCYCALYELSDPELVSAIIAAKPAVEVILTNTGDDDHTNAAARAKLHQKKVKVHDRMLTAANSNAIGHNKFVVYADANQKPQAVVTGSTNWTPTGLCAQTNNVILIESPEVAAHYLAYWKKLLADKAKQAATLRTWSREHGLDVPHGANGALGTTGIWFAPSTTQKNKPSTNPPRPVDLAEVFDLIEKADKAILFLAFKPGAPSILEKIRDVAAAREAAKKPLYIRGSITDNGPVGQFATFSYQRTLLQKPDVYVSGIAGVPDAYSYWEAEIAQLGHAVIHDKILVLDPFDDDPVVVTGSHNLGFKASYSNDENMLILRGNHAVASAYAAHVLDVHNHFRWRYKLQKLARDGKLDEAWGDLDDTDAWQDKYFGGFLEGRDRALF